MASWSIPVCKELWIETDCESEFLSNSLNEVSRHPHVISNLNSKAWADLILPLTWHDFSICSRDLDTSIEASFVMRICNVSSEVDIATNGAIERSLVWRETVAWPSKWSSFKSAEIRKYGIFLLNSIPWLFTFSGFKNWLWSRSEICLSWNQLFVGGVFPAVALAKNQYVVSSSERIWIKGSWLENNLWVFCRSLIARGPIMIPGWKLVNWGNLTFKSSALGSDSECAVNPNVFSDNFATLIKVLEGIATWALLMWFFHNLT